MVPEPASSGGSDRQTLAALGATGIDDRAATFGLHASAESVGALATNDGRLISAFHGESSEAKNQRRKKRLPRKSVVLDR
jgi:hypothetical protein